MKINETQLRKIIKECIKETMGFANMPIQDAGQGEKGKINVIKTPEEAIRAVQQDGGFYFFVGQVLKDNKSNANTNEFLLKKRNEVIKAVEQELGVKLHGGTIHLGNPQHNGSVNQYQYFYVEQ
jgi:hypothetical protein